MESLKAGDSLAAGQQLDNGDSKLTMQDDGNLVLYTGDQAVWATSTSGGAKATLQEDGNFVVYDAAGEPAWASDTSGNSGVTLTLGSGGSLALKDSDGKLLWSAGSSPAASTYTVQSGDTLWAIAEKHYGDGSQFQKIADANGITDPDQLDEGQILTLP